MRFALSLAAVVAALVFSGCAPTGVGDPCTIEEPPGGFNQSDTVIEIDSVQCRSGTCMVFNLETFCTTQCEADSDCRADWYEEGPGQDGVDPAYCEARVEVGSPSTQGRYCVPSYARE